MSSTNTPVTQADVDEWARDIGAHSDNANGPVYYYVSKAKWDQVHDMLGRLLADRDGWVERYRRLDNHRCEHDAELRARAEKAEAELETARAVAIESDKIDGYAGSGVPDLAGWLKKRSESARRKANRNALLADLGEMTRRAEKAEAAQADERSARAMDLARLSKAEASNGVAMLRRLRSEFQREKESKAREAKYARDDAKCDAYEDAMREQATLIGELMGHIDRMLAEAEKPAEPVTQIGSIDDDAIAAGEAEAKAGETIPVEDLIEELKDREGDDVLRAFRAEARRSCAESGYEPFPEHYWLDAAIDELCRRALGEEGRP